MKFHYDIAGCQQIYEDIPVYGNGAAMLEGAAVVKGATAGTNQGFAILAPTGLAGVLGILGEVHALVTAGLDSKQDGTAYTFRKVLINPFAVILAEWDTGAIAIASVVTVTPTITSLENDIDGGWLLGSDGQLQYITTSASGSCTTKTATGWTSAITVQKITPLFHATGTLNSTSTKLNQAAAAGTGKIRVKQNYIKANGLPFQKLDPTKHSGLILTRPVAYSDIIFTDHAYGING
jgi:hypothetical protein